MRHQPRLLPDTYERRALRRYARVLQQTSRTLVTLATMSSPSSVSRLVAAARHVTVMPLLDQRLGTLAAGTSSKVLQRQMATLRTAMPSSLLEQLQTFPAFADAYAYFRAIVEALHPLLDALPAEIPRRPEEPDAPPRPERRRQRRVTTSRHDD